MKKLFRGQVQNYVLVCLRGAKRGKKKGGQKITFRISVPAVFQLENNVTCPNVHIHCWCHLVDTFLQHWSLDDIDESWTRFTSIWKYLFLTFL